MSEGGPAGVGLGGAGDQASAAALKPWKPSDSLRVALTRVRGMSRDDWLSWTGVQAQLQAERD